MIWERPVMRRLAGTRGARADLRALAAGLLAALALPPLYLVPVLLLAVPLLLRLIEAAPGPAVAARRGFFFGFGLHLIGLYWITDAILVEAAQFWWLVPLAVPALAAVLALFIALPAAVARRARPGWPMAMTFAGAWGLADLARQFVASGFPWNPLGSVWEFPGYPGDVMIQMAALVGVHGMTVATVFLASMPVLDRRWRLCGAALLAGWVTFGVWRLNQPAPSATGLTVLLVQGNVAQGQKWSRELMAAIFHHYLDLTHEAVEKAGSGPAVAVWPETASPALLQTDAEARQLIAEAADGAQSLIGAVRYDRSDAPRNSLFAIGAGGVIEGLYDKWHLVPFGEYQPAWLPLGVQLVPGGGFAPGPGPRTLHVPGLPPLGPLICYEAIFSAQIINPADRPAWMVNITNDAWFGNSSGPRQHLAAVRLRAVEEGLPLMRAANTGISAAFDARGHELGRLDLDTSGVLSIRLPGSLPAPLYARAGLLLAAGISTILTVAGLLGSRSKRTERHLLS